MSQVTDVGVGSFIGHGDLDVAIPGLQESVIIQCNWGAGIGYYLSIIAFILLISLSLVKTSRKLVKKIRK